MNTQTIPSKLNHHTPDVFVPEVLSPAWYRDPVAVAHYVRFLEREGDAKATDRIVERKPAYNGYKIHHVDSRICSVVMSAETRWSAAELLYSDVRFRNAHAAKPDRVCRTCWGELMCGQHPRKLDGPGEYVKPLTWTKKEKAALSAVNSSVGGRAIHRGTRGIVNDAERY